MNSQTTIEAFEDTTGNTFDPNGPKIAECPYCDTLTQYASDHSCYGLRCEQADRLGDDIEEEY